MLDSLLLLGIFTSLLAGQFARVELINALANVYVHEFLLVFFIISSIVRFGFQPLQNAFRSKAVFIFILLFFVSYVLSLGDFTLMQNGVALLYLARLALYSLFGIYLFTQMKKRENIRKYVLGLIYTFSIVLLILTAIQYIFYPDFLSLFAYGWDPHLYRASAAYLDVFVAAALYGLLALYWLSKKQMFMSLLFIVALVFSFSRSAYIAFFICLVYLFVVNKKWKEMLIFFALFILLITFVPKPFGEGVKLLRTASINSRIFDYRRALTIWQEKPLFGFGYNRIRFAKEHLNLATIDDKSHSLASFHSSFLIILVTTGAIGFCTFIFLTISLFKKYPRIRVYLIYIFSLSLFDNVLLHVLVLLPLLFLLAEITYSSFE